MKMRLLWVMVLAAAIPGKLLGQSIHPFFKEDDAVFKPELLGKWTLEKDVTVEFRDLGEKTYGITLYGDNNSAFYFRAHLFCVNDKYFLDGQVAGMKLPEDADEKSPEAGIAQMQEPSNKDFMPDRSDFLLNRSHGLLRVSFGANPDEFTMSVWKESWLPKMAEVDKLTVAHTKDEMGRILLTAETDELREWVRELPAEAFDKPEHLQRAEAGKSARAEEPEKDGPPAGSERATRGATLS